MTKNNIQIKSLKNIHVFSKKGRRKGEGKGAIFALKRLAFAVLAKQGEGTVAAFWIACRAILPTEKHQGMAKFVCLIHRQNLSQLHFNIKWVFAG